MAVEERSHTLILLRLGGLGGLLGISVGVDSSVGRLHGRRDSRLVVGGDGGGGSLSGLDLVVGHG